MNKLLPFFILLSLYLALSLVPTSARVDFAREVLPILSDKCYACHGPDTKKKDLVRLDLEELAKKDLGDYHAIDPDDLGKVNYFTGLWMRMTLCRQKISENSLAKRKRSYPAMGLVGSRVRGSLVFVPPTKAE